MKESGHDRPRLPIEIGKPQNKPRQISSLSHASKI